MSKDNVMNCELRFSPFRPYPFKLDTLGEENTAIPNIRNIHCLELGGQN
jgi:hypothetical protein